MIRTFSATLIRVGCTKQHYKKGKKVSYLKEKMTYLKTELFSKGKAGR